MHVRCRRRATTPARGARAFFDSALQRIRALPGVESPPAAIDNLPLQGGSVQPIVLEGQAELLPRDQPTVQVRQITPGYLRAMRIPVAARPRLRRRATTDVMLVSRGAARLLWGDGDPVGRSVTLPLISRPQLQHGRRHRRRRQAGRACRGAAADGLRLHARARLRPVATARPPDVGAAGVDRRGGDRRRSAPSIPSSRCRTSARWSEVRDER